MEQIDTAFAVEVATTEIRRIGSLNHDLKGLSDSGVYVYAGAYSHRYTLHNLPAIEISSNASEGQGAKTKQKVNVMKLMLLIHILGRDVPSFTVQVERRVEDEFLDKDSSDERLPDLMQKQRFQRSLDRLMPQKKRDDEDTI